MIGIALVDPMQALEGLKCLKSANFSQKTEKVENPINKVSPKYIKFQVAAAANDGDNDDKKIVGKVAFYPMVTPNTFVFFSFLLFLLLLNLYTNKGSCRCRKKTIKMQLTPFNSLFPMAAVCCCCCCCCL